MLPKEDTCEAPPADPRQTPPGGPGRRIRRRLRPRPRLNRATLRRDTYRVLAGTVVLATLLAAAHFAVRVTPGLLEYARSAGAWGPLLFVLFYAATVVAWLPASVPTLAAGVLFGPVEGTLYALAGAALGAAGAFLVAHSAARGLVERHLHASRTLELVDRAIGREGGRIVFLLRLSPVLPFSPISYLLGLTRIRFRHYILATAAGVAPAMALYVYAGHTAGRVALGDAGLPSGPLRTGLLVLGIVATLAATALLARIARNAIRRAEARAE